MTPAEAPAPPLVLPRTGHPRHPRPPDRRRLHGPGRPLAAPAWPLIPMNANPGVTHSTIHWPLLPDPFREEMRLAAWTLVNGELPSVFLRERHPTWALATARSALPDDRDLGAAGRVWLTDHDITTLGDCTTKVLGEYGRHVRDSGAARITVHSGLSSLTRLWVFDQLTMATEMAASLGDGRGGRLPAASDGGSARTPPRRWPGARTMGPLLGVAASRDDILAAWAESRTVCRIAPPRVPRPASTAACRLPSGPHLDRPAGALQTTTRATAAMPGRRLHRRAQSVARSTQVYNGLRDRAVEASGSPVRGTRAPARSVVPVSGLRGRGPRTASIDFTETRFLMRHWARRASSSSPT